MTSIQSLTLEVPDPAAAEQFYGAAFGLNGRLRFSVSETPTSGFRGFTVSLVVSQPGNVDALVDTALEQGATPLKPAAKSLWGYAGVIQAPDGSIWKVATSSKKDSGPATREIDQMVLLLGVADFVASKRFYVEHGQKVAKSFARSYAQFEAPAGGVGLGLYKRTALAKDAGVPPQGSGSHRLVINSDAGAFTDPDGFAWEGTTPDRDSETASRAIAS